MFTIHCPTQCLLLRAGVSRLCVQSAQVWLDNNTTVHGTPKIRTPCTIKTPRLVIPLYYSTPENRDTPLIGTPH